jgi:WD40 repeat protein
LGCRILSIICVAIFTAAAFGNCGRRHGFANLNVLEESPDGSSLLFGGIVLNSAYEAITVWDLESNSSRTRLVAPDTVLCLLLSEDGEFGFVGGEFPSVIRYDLRTGSSAEFLQVNKSNVHSLAESLPMRNLIAGGRNVQGGFVNIYDAQSKSFLWSPELEEPDHVVIELLVSPNGKILYVLTAVEISAWDLRSRKRVFSYSQPRLIFRNFQYIGVNNQIVIGDLLGRLHVFDSKGSKVQDFQAHDGSVYDTEMIDRDGLLISVGKDEKIKKWNVANWEYDGESDQRGKEPTHLEKSHFSNYYWIGYSSGRVRKMEL